MSEQPKLLIEKAMADEISWDQVGCQAPHCDARILHAPGECDTCDLEEMKALHVERELVGVNYTGHSDRPFPCPVDKARAADNYNAWGGNRPTKYEDCGDCGKQISSNYPHFCPPTMN